MNTLSLLISFLFHPLLMATAGVAFILYTGSITSQLPSQARNMIILLTATGTFLLPAITIPLFMIRGKLTSIMLGERRERYFPLAMTLIFYIFTFFLFLKLPVYRQIHSFMLGSTLTVTIVLLATLRFKMSAHLAGLGGICALFFIVSFMTHTNLMIWFTAALLASGLTGTARMYLGEHNLFEVLSGFTTGFLCIGVCLMVY